MSEINRMSTKKKKSWAGCWTQSHPRAYKVRAIILLTRRACGASHYCLTHCRVIGYNCTLATSAVAEWFVVHDYKNL